MPAAGDSRGLFFASSEKSVGHRYAPMGAGSSARAAREPDVGKRGFSFPVLSQLPFRTSLPSADATPSAEIYHQWGTCPHRALYVQGAIKCGTGP